MLTIQNTDVTQFSPHNFSLSAFIARGKILILFFVLSYLCQTSVNIFERTATNREINTLSHFSRLIKFYESLVFGRYEVKKMMPTQSLLIKFWILASEIMGFSEIRSWLCYTWSSI